LSLRQKSDQGIRLKGESCINDVFLVKETAVSLPIIPVCPGIQRNWISNPISLREDK
jgi:hypothetical protein